MKKQTMRALTPKQIEALHALHYGEIRAQYHKVGQNIFKQWYMPVDGRPPLNVTSRITALCKRRLCRYMAVDSGLDRTKHATSVDATR